MAVVLRHGRAEQRPPLQPIFWGQTHIASGLASILNATTPLFTVVVAHLLTDDEKVTAPKVAALLSGIIGVAVLIGPTVAQPNDSLWGELACLGAALSYAFAGIYGRRFRTMGVKPLDAAAGQVTASTLLILPIMLSVEQPWNGAVPTANGWTALAALALLSTALAYVLYFRILAAGQGNQPAVRHVPDPGDVDPAGCGLPAGAAGTPALRGNG